MGLAGEIGEWECGRAASWRTKPSVTQERLRPCKGSRLHSTGIGDSLKSARQQSAYGCGGGERGTRQAASGVWAERLQGSPQLPPRGRPAEVFQDGTGARIAVKAGFPPAAPACTEEPSTASAPSRAHLTVCCALMPCQSAYRGGHRRAVMPGNPARTVTRTGGFSGKLRLWKVETPARGCSGLTAEPRRIALHLGPHGVPARGRSGPGVPSIQKEFLHKFGGLLSSCL